MAKTFKLLFTLGVILAISFTASAYDFHVGQFYYKYNSDGTVTITRSTYDAPVDVYYGHITIPSSVEYDGIKYTVTAIDVGVFENQDQLVSVIIPNSIITIGWGAFSCCALKYLTIGNSVKIIDGYAFSCCYNLKEVDIPNSVTSIGEEAFSGCDLLTSIEIPNSVTYIGKEAFEGCSGLTSVTIGNSVTSIGGGAFSGCTSLTSIDIPDSVTSIGDSAFYGAPWFNNQPDGLVYAGKIAYIYKGNMPENTSITIKDGTLVINNNCFYGRSGLTSIVIPNSVTKIGEWAFFRCTSLTSVTIPNSVTSIGKCAFRECFGLTTVTIPNSVTFIGSSAFSGTLWLYNQTDDLVYAGKIAYLCKGNMPSITIKDGTIGIADYCFSGCSGLESITIPNSVTSIGKCAFRGCTGLTSVTIPNSVTAIEGNPFTFCSQLTSIVVESGNSTYDSRGNCNAIVNTSDNELVVGCKNTVIPNSVTSIGDNAFFECSGLTSVTIPNSVTSIGGSAFQDCAGLTSVTIPNSVSEIGLCAFQLCSGLKSVTIGNSVTEICDGAFAGCTRLKSVTNLAETPQAIDIIDDVFVGIDLPTCKLFVPKDVVDAYATAEIWEDFGEIIGLEDEPITYSALDEDAATVSHVNPNVDGTVEIPETTEIDGQEYSVAAIADNAFESCEEITSVIIPNSVVSIGANAFSGCSGLKSVTLPNWTEEEVPTHLLSIREITPKQIGAYAFANCTGLEDVYNDNAAPQFVTADVFDGIDVSKVCLHVPEASIPLYQAAEVWKNFHIEALDGVDEISTDKGNAEIVDIYNLQGVRLKVPARGQVNIVRYKDGTAKKVVN